jgi:hypothetical protein
MDFREVFSVQQLDADLYDYAWTKFDLANDENDQVVEFDFGQECTAKELYKSMEEHWLDPYAEQMFQYFKSHPLSCWSMADEY